MTTAITKPVSLKNGSDKVVAERLKAMHSELSGFATKSFLFGIYAHYIKEVELKHSQFGPWLQQNAPELSRLDSKTQQPKATSSLTRHLDFAKEVVEAFGISLTTALQRIKAVTEGKFPTAGNFSRLLIEDTDAAKKIIPKHEELVELLANNSRRQVVHTLVQMEEDDNGVEKRKRGRLKGQGGATKEQREAAAAREERERLESIQIKADETTDFLLEYSDVKGFAKLDEIPGGEKTLKKLADAVAYAHNFFTSLKKSTK